MTRKQRPGKARKRDAGPNDGVRRLLPLWVLLGFLAITLFVYFKGYRFFTGSDDTTVTSAQDRQALTTLLTDELRSMGIKKEWIRKRSTGTSVDALDVRVPCEISLVTCNLIAHQLFRGAQVAIHSAKENPARHELVLMAGTAGKLDYTVTFIKDSRLNREPAVIAVVLSGAGASFNAAVRAVLEIGLPLTLALKPGLDATAEIAGKAPGAGKEVMVELPVAGPDESKRKAGAYAVEPGLTLQQVRQRITLALAAVPGGRGICHAGTGDTVLDRSLAGKFTEAARASSVYYIGPAGAGCMAADLDLDGLRSTGIIEKLNEAARISFQQGTALVTGTVQRETVRVLQQYLPELTERGIRIVRASELMEARS